jgi:hypothetical protein
MKFENINNVIFFYSKWYMKYAYVFMRTKRTIITIINLDKVNSVIDKLKMN